MTTSCPPDKYNKITIGLHWFMLLLLAAVFLTIELRTQFPKGSDPRNALKMWHFMLGLSVLVLVIIRLIARFRFTTPPIFPQPPKWQTALSHFMHFSLYAFMLAMPIMGWLILSGEGKEIPFFGLQLPALMGPDKELAHVIEEIHETLGEVGYYLIGLHALVGLAHHYVKKDNTLNRILP